MFRLNVYRLLKNTVKWLLSATFKNKSCFVRCFHGNHMIQVLLKTETLAFGDFWWIKPMRAHGHRLLSEYNKASLPVVLCGSLNGAFTVSSCSRDELMTSVKGQTGRTQAVYAFPWFYSQAGRILARDRADKANVLCCLVNYRKQINAKGLFVLLVLFCKLKMLFQKTHLPTVFHQALIIFTRLSVISSSSIY